MLRVLVHYFIVAPLEIWRRDVLFWQAFNDTVYRNEDIINLVHWGDEVVTLFELLSLACSATKI